MEYQAPPVQVQQFCIRQTGDSSVPGRYFIAFNDLPAEAFDQEAYNYLSVVVPKCEGDMLNIPHIGQSW